MLQNHLNQRMGGAHPRRSTLQHGATMSARRCRETSAQQRPEFLLVHLMHFDNIAFGIVEENLVPLVHE